MTSNSASGPSRLDKIRRYRRLTYVTVFLGVVGLLVATELGYPLVGLVIYWVSLGVFSGICKWTPVQLFDERDIALERRASYLTIQIAVVVLVVGFSVLFVLEETTTVEIPPRIWGAYLALSGLLIVFGIVYVFLRYRR